MLGPAMKGLVLAFSVFAIVGGIAAYEDQGLDHASSVFDSPTADEDWDIIAEAYYDSLTEDSGLDDLEHAYDSEAEDDLDEEDHEVWESEDEGSWDGSSLGGGSPGLESRSMLFGRKSDPNDVSKLAKDLSSYIYLPGRPLTAPSVQMTKQKGKKTVKATTSADATEIMYTQDGHFTVLANQNGPYPTADPKKIRKISFQAGGDGPVARYLDYGQNKIYSTTLPAVPGGDDPKFFFTAALSGCAIYIDKVADGRLIVYHANAQGLGSDAAHAAEMRNQRKRARLQWGKIVRQSIKEVGALEKSEYYKKKGDGVHVVGIHGPKGWEFYYQLFTIKPTKVVTAKKWWPKK